MLKQRIITAVVAIPVLLGLMFLKNHLYFFILINIFVCLGLVELYQMLFNRIDAYKPGKFQIWLAAILGTALFCLLGIDILWPGTVLSIFSVLDIFLLLSIGYIAFNLFSESTIAIMAQKSVAVIAGWLYVPILLTFILKIHNLQNGANLLFLFVVIIFTCDSGAYFVGRKFGKHRLLPVVSPKKSIEGSIGGAVVSLLCALIVGRLMLDMSFLAIGVIALVTSTLGQIGDLIESMIKRFANIKDSGTLFYGHGGVLDRLDSILVAGFVFYWTYQLMV